MKKTLYLMALMGLGFLQTVYAKTGAKKLTVENAKVKITVSIDNNGYLTRDSVFAKPSWAKDFDQRSFGAVSDAGFKMSLMWTAWSAPGKSSNADNLINLTQHDFKFEDAQTSTATDGSKVLTLNLKGRNTPLQVQVVYKIGADDFYARRKVQVKVPKIPDHYAGKHYLRKLYPLQENLQTQGKIIKKGGFGQPVAIAPQNDPQTGIFWGMEYPTAQNNYVTEKGQQLLSVGDFYGKRIDTKWTSSNWVVIGLSPQPNVRRWFMSYVDDIRAQPVRPYLLYNSWYDLQSPQLVRDNPKHVMNEENALRSIKTLQRRLVQKRGVKLNAFVLDDGWDVYRSDWKISQKQFPHGFKPLVKQLDKTDTDTDLGTWFGPIGGYSHRSWRVDWMKKHGYETIGKDQLDIAGTKYHKLFKERITDFTKNRGVAYYKWDGIQFSSSNPTNGHPVGVYSRRAIMDSVISLDHAVWNENPDAFLNITSGTWLSPWWVKYATTIWMQGSDYGYTKVPSMSRRDRAITYRDLVLYEDFKQENSWFPMANLMTHGIIKGELQNLAAKEPLNKFTNNALLYFARGVAMWELYISPDLLTDTQWDVLAEGIKWAKDRFDLLKHTVMIGGNPGEGEPYGYAHFKGDNGIVIMRNPTISSQKISVKLNESLGLEAGADSLVVERVYPQKKISSELASSGSELETELKGYEMAIYEVFPLKGVGRPLLAGATFTSKSTDNKYQIEVLDVDENKGGARFLNPELLSEVQKNNNRIDADQLKMPASPDRPVITKTEVHQSDQSSLKLTVSVAPSVEKATLATLLQGEATNVSKKKGNLSVTIKVDGQSREVNKEEQKGGWGWYKILLAAGTHTVDIDVNGTKKIHKWTGHASLWFIAQQAVMPAVLSMKGSDIDVPVFPPVVTPTHTIKRQQKLGSYNISVQ